MHTYRIGDAAALPGVGRRCRSGPFRVVSLVSRESAEELEPEPGVPAVAVIKSTDVAVESP
ncbi:hypothetical protein ABT300_10790 [Streptomyces sp. NPDC001027]|uniref:hypothetical protein n=1 Tax=Streptomyces sp. NPDC001027 TaxID=3154771 RepID=UPI00331FE4CC